MSSLLDRIKGIIRAPQLSATPQQLTGFPSRTDNLPRWQGISAQDQSHLVSLPYGDIRYWVYPADNEAGSRPWMLLVHGFRGDHHGLTNLIDGLGEYNLMVPDLPGFGESPALRRKHTVDAYAMILRELLKHALPMQRIFLLGHSFGSIVATRLATDLPQLRKLILVNPIAELPLSAANRTMSMLTAQYYRLSSILPRKLGYGLLRSPLVVRFMTEFMVESDDPQIRALAHEQHHRYFSGFASRQVLEEAYQASISNHCAMDAPQVTVPALLIAGERDPLGSIEAQQSLAESFQQKAELEVIPDVGHLIHYEKAGTAVAAIKRFLETQ